MAFDSTVLGDIFYKITKYKQLEISEDLYLASSNTKQSRFFLGNAGEKNVRYAWWISDNEKSWGTWNQYAQSCNKDINNDADQQKLPRNNVSIRKKDPTNKQSHVIQKLITFDSHVYNIFSEYVEKAGLDRDLDQLKNIVIECCTEMGLHDECLKQEISAQTSQDALLVFLIQRARNAFELNEIAQDYKKKHPEVYSEVIPPASTPTSLPERPAVSENAYTDPQIMSLAELQAATGMSPLDIATALVANDLALYPNIPQANEGNPHLWEKYLYSYPETFRYLVSDNTIIGNWSFMALSGSQLALAQNGHLMEAELELSDSAFLFLPGVYNGYLLNLSVNERYISSENYIKLFQSFAEQLESFAKQGIYFKHFYVNVFRPDHEAMYKTFGFRFLCDNVSYGKIYELQFTPFPAVLGKFTSNLRKLYYERFEAYQM